MKAIFWTITILGTVLFGLGTAVNHLTALF